MLTSSKEEIKREGTTIQGIEGPLFSFFGGEASQTN